MSILTLFHKVGAAYKNDRSEKLAAHVLLIGGITKMGGLFATSFEPIAKNTTNISQIYHKYITNIPQIYHKNTTKCDIVPKKCDSVPQKCDNVPQKCNIIPQNRVFYYKM